MEYQHNIGLKTFMEEEEIVELSFRSRVTTAVLTCVKMSIKMMVPRSSCKRVQLSKNTVHFSFFRYTLCLT